MNATARRQFLKAGTSLAVLGALPRAVQAAMGPNDKYDLLVRNANVLDPSQGLTGKRDIGIRYGQIETIAPTIAAERGARVMDVGGKLVTPGLIDLHCHSYPYGSAIGIPADELVRTNARRPSSRRATPAPTTSPPTAASSCRRRGRASTPSSTSAVAGLAGFPVPELYNIDYAQAEAAARAVAENADMVLGIKVRMSENVIARHGTEPLKRAIQACEMSGVPAKVMCHIGGVADRALMAQVLDLLRPGDVLTHCYSGAPNIAGDGTNIVQDGKLLPAALEAKKRGVSSTSATAAAASTTPSPRRRSRRAARPTRSRRTSMSSRATRRGCRTCRG